MNKPEKTVAIIQARMASSRLPGKVLVDLGGKTMLERVVDRVRKAQLVDEVVVATTIDSSDETVEKFCAERGYLCYRGSMQDVLDRYYQAACLYHAETIVRITADCPLMDPRLIDEVIRAFRGEQRSKFENSGRSISIGDLEKSTLGGPGVYDFTANRLPPPWHRTYPIGLDVEVCSFWALERAWKEADQPHQREHVMPYLYEKHGRFRVLVLDHDPDYGMLRWTVDTPQDLELVRRIFAQFTEEEYFSWQDVLALFQRQPELALINAEVKPKSTFEVDERA